MAGMQQHAAFRHETVTSERQDLVLQPESRARSTDFARRRLAREWRTLVAMVHIYCASHHHHGQGECGECAGLLNYARARLERCRFGVEKPTCAKCPVHCYKPDRREQVREVMRFAGPRMLWRHPVLSAWHLLDSMLRRPTAFSQK